MVVIDPLSEEPPVTLVKDMPPSVSPLEQPTLDMPGSSSSSPAPYSPPSTPQPGWSVPPPPAYPKSKQQSLSIASLVLGIVSMTIGWCCYFGVLTSPIAIGLGLYSLSQIKKDPEQYGGKGIAIGGIVAGSLYFVYSGVDNPGLWFEFSDEWREVAKLVRRCPTCNKTFADRNLAFCIDDGTPLVPVIEDADEVTRVSGHGSESSGSGGAGGDVKVFPLINRRELTRRREVCRTRRSAGFGRGWWEFWHSSC